MSGMPPRSYTTFEKEQVQKVRDLLAGRAAPPTTPKWAERTALGDFIARNVSGIDPGAGDAPVDASPVHCGMSEYKRQAWSSFSDAEQNAINAGDPELVLAYEQRYHAAVTGETTPEETEEA
jgi:hypothetical protein